MFVLDTNVLSALIGVKPNETVAKWISAQPTDVLFTTAVTQAEILSGIAIMPNGRRRQRLASAVREMFLEDFGGRVLPFDVEAAGAYAGIFAERRRAGRPIATADCMIASVARANSGTVVTRDPAGFAGCGVAVFDPWKDA